MAAAGEEKRPTLQLEAIDLVRLPNAGRYFQHLFHSNLLTSLYLTFFSKYMMKARKLMNATAARFSAVLRQLEGKGRFYLNNNRNNNNNNNDSQQRNCLSYMYHFVQGNSLRSVHLRWGVG